MHQSTRSIKHDEFSMFASAVRAILVHCYKCTLHLRFNKCEFSTKSFFDNNHFWLDFYLYKYKNTQYVGDVDNVVDIFLIQI